MDSALDELFKQYEALKWEFTYGHEDDPEKYNALQVGLVAYFYIDQGWRPEKREALTEALALYDRYYGQYLKYGYFENPNHPESYQDKTLKQRQHQIISEEDAAVEFVWTEQDFKEYVNNYQISCFTPACWFEETHRSISFVSFYLPFEVLKDNGPEIFKQRLREFCTLLKPMHGLAGLGLQQCYRSHEYQHLEYIIGHEFSGLDISGGNSDERLRNGFKSVNWFTLLGDELVAKLGGQAALETQNPDPRITFTAYDGGLMVQAGEVPALGYVQIDPWPELYVKVNNLLRPARAPEIDSLGFGSIGDEVRYNDRTTAQWLARFDNPETLPAAAQGAAITVQSGKLCRYSGLWSATVASGEMIYEELNQGFEAPRWRDGQGIEHDVLWTLLRRDDGGAVRVP